VQKGGAGDPTGTLKATYDLASDVVAEAEVGVPSSKISASLAHSGLVKGMKATLSGNPQDVKTAKLALQYLYGAVGVKADITELTAGAPKADINLCWADGDHAAGVTFFSTRHDRHLAYPSRADIRAILRSNGCGP
jgi:voltage-dependent anion channel protein 2